MLGLWGLGGDSRPAPGRPSRLSSAPLHHRLLAPGPHARRRIDTAPRGGQHRWVAGAGARVVGWWLRRVPGSGASSPRPTRPPRAGKRLGLRSPGMVLLLVWCVWLLTAKPLCVILENVVGFDVGVMVEILGDLYDHVVLRVAPRHAGFTLLRTRLYDTFSNSSDLHPLVIKFIPYLQSI